MTSDLGQMEVEEVEEAGEPVVERVGVVLGGAPVSGAGPGADTGGDREPESGQVVAQAEVGEPVGVEGGGGAPLQSVVTPGGGAGDVALGAVPRPPRGGKRKGGSRAGGGSDTKVRPRGSGSDSSLSVDDGAVGSGFQAAVGVEGSGSLSVSPAPGGLEEDPTAVGVLGRAPVAGSAFHALPPVVSRPMVGVSATGSGGQVPPS